jgi:hypothetical protein
VLYTRFSPISRNTWEVSTPAKSPKPIATITRRRNGQCAAAITADHALNREELSSLSVFMQEHERAS